MRFRAFAYALTLLSAFAATAAAEDEGKKPEGAPPADPAGFDFSTLFEPGDGWRSTRQIFVWNNETEPETLDPAVMTGVTEHQLALALFEGLASHHPETLEPIPGAAWKWDVSADGTVYTFHLRKDARWSNGDPLTAEDFRWSWERALREPNCQYKEMFFPIRGAEAFVEANEKDWSTVGVAVTSPHTLTVTLHTPCAYFLELCAFETLMPVHRRTLEQFGQLWTRPENIVVNGPFALDVWKPRDRIEMVPNAKWWNRGIVRLERMVIRAIDDQSTSYNEYLSGGVDWIRSIAAGKVTDAQQQADYYVQPYLGTYFFRFNTTEPPFDDPKVRKAFNQAIDKRVICETVLKAGQVPATGIVSPGIHGFPEFKGPGYDPVKARALLAEAGFPEGKGFPKVDVLYNTSESHKQVCEKLVEMWKTNLGVTVTLRNCEWKVYLEETRKLSYSIQRAGWIGDYADPATFLDMWCTGRGNNNTGWSSAAYDDLLARSTKETDPAKRYALLAEAEKLLCTDEFPFMPIYFYVNQGMLRPEVRGWHENIRDLHPFQYLFLAGPTKASAAAAGSGK
ncbi:MAG: Periplasmic oligopeptide-binding protein [Planctomycetes bacterium]|nr:Periplasmic oligopeptide-binding protein [Planctomycetota bacterium]